MGLPVCAVREILIFSVNQQLANRSIERTLLHIGKCIGVDHIVFMPGPQEFEKVDAAFRTGCGKEGKPIIGALVNVLVFYSVYPDSPGG